VFTGSNQSINQPLRIMKVPWWSSTASDQVDWRLCDGKRILGGAGHDGKEDGRRRRWTARRRGLRRQRWGREMVDVRDGRRRSASSDAGMGGYLRLTEGLLYD
jgi:hypothetical protein